MNETKLNSFITCKNDSLNVKNFVLNNSSDVDSINSAIEKLVVKNNTCLSLGKESLQEIKGNVFEKKLNKAIDLSMQRITAENYLYSMIQKDLKTEIGLKKDSIRFDYYISRFFRGPEQNLWMELTTQIKDKESKVEHKSFFDFTTIMIIVGLIIWAWVAGKKKQEAFKNEDNNDSKLLKKLLDDYKNKKD